MRIVFVSWRDLAHALGVDPEFKRMPVQYGWWLDRRKKTGYPG